MFVVRAVHRSRLFVSAESSSWVSITTDWLSLILSTPVFSYYSGLALDHVYGKLINVNASSEFAVYMLKKLLHVANAGLVDTFKSDSRFQPSVLYLVALSATVIELVKNIGACFSFSGTIFDMATFSMTMYSVKCVS